jgi:outer membrane protein OmpA-like peptidoglycan-associated protein
MNNVINYWKIGIMALFLVSGVIIQGCKSSNMNKGAAIGAGSGAVVGGVIGHYAKNTAAGAIIGATVGGATGAIIGRHMDKQAAELKADMEGATIERVGEGIKITFDSGLLFGFDSYVLSTTTMSNLTSLAKTLNKYDDTEILIEGHTDSKGAEDYNMTLSKKRSESVANYLKGQSVKSSRITTEGYGELQPISESDDLNRRVEIAIYANKKMVRAAEKGQL